MILCLDIGNTHIYGGLFVNQKIKLRFRYPSTYPCTSDVLGLFLRNVLSENGMDTGKIKAISLCSVVPSLDYSVVAACKKYFAIDPLELKPGVKTGLKLDIKNPLEVGADRIANAVAAIDHFPNKNIMIVDFGTATTICAINKQHTYLGGAILPGMKLSMEALSQKAAKLSDVDITAPKQALGKSTSMNIQSGLYYGQLGAIKEIIARIKTEAFSGESVMLISTGGYAHLFEQQKFFTVNVTDLILHGLYVIWEKNQCSQMASSIS